METLQKLLPDNDRTNYEENELRFWQNMLEKNEVFIDYMHIWDEILDNIIEKCPAFSKYNLKPHLQETMNTYSPARRTK